MATTTPGLVCRSHVHPRDVSANPLLRALTGNIARKPAIPCLGRAAHAHISGPTCESEDPGSYSPVNVRDSGPTCARVRFLGSIPGQEAGQRPHVRAGALARSSFACNSIR